MMLVVVDSANPDFSDRLVISLDVDFWQGVVGREFFVSSCVGGTELNSYPAVAARSYGEAEGRVRIAFDAATKILYASYNGIPLGHLDVDVVGSSWNMSDGSSFSFALGGDLWTESSGFSYSGNEIYADNFEYRSGRNLTYLLTVSSGSGGGNYTNNAVVDITASTAAAGSESISIGSGLVYADNFEETGMVQPLADADDNGLPDGWELRYFGATGVDPSAVCSNGINTIRESYIAGLDPTSPDAFFGITGGDAINRIIQWEAVSGRVYSVWWTTNLLNGFVPVLTNYLDSSATDTLHKAESTGFYKLTVQLAE